MTDEAKLFHDEVREKSITARSARNKHKRASTPGAIKSEAIACSESVCNLNKPIDYKDFKKLSASTQKQYLEGLIHKYSVGPYVICHAMNCSGTAIAAICKSLNIKTPKYTSKALSDKFIKQFAGKPRSECKQKKEPVTMQICTREVSIKGAYNASSILPFLTDLFPAGQNAKVTILVEAL